jgi:hypothetical protein
VGSVGSVTAVTGTGLLAANPRRNREHLGAEQKNGNEKDDLELHDSSSQTNLLVRQL